MRFVHGAPKFSDRFAQNFLPFFTAEICPSFFVRVGLQFLKSCFGKGSFCN